MIRIALLLLMIAPLSWLAWHQLHAPPSIQNLSNGGQLRWVDCWFDKPLWRPVHCARFKTASSNDKQVYDLPVVYFPGPFWQQKNSPVLYIAGGPGGSNWLGEDDIETWYDWIDDVAWSRDVVLYDQRGVGLSEPNLSCPKLIALREGLLPQDIPAEQAALRMREVANQCRLRLEQAGVDLSLFNTRTNAQDAHDLLSALGGQEWNLYGVSYGTRVALDMMRLAPAKIRSVVLDSVYPPQVHSELSDPWLLQRTLHLYQRICALAASCEQTPETAENILAMAYDSLKQSPMRMHLIDASGQRLQSVLYTHDDFIWFLFESMYQWQLIPDLPEVVSAVAHGEDSPKLREMMRDSVLNYLDDSISDPVANAVDCNDMRAVSSAEFEVVRAQVGDHFNLLNHAWKTHFCRDWKHSEPPADFRQAVSSDIPTLLLTGEFDPVTPPEWAYLAAETLSQGHVFQFPAIGHGVLDSHGCAVGLVKSFLDSPTAPNLPKCLSHL